MDEPQDSIESANPASSTKFEGLLWLILLVLIFSVAAVLFLRNWPAISETLGIESSLNFDKVMNSKGLHDIMLEDGRAYDISYETSSKRDFTGLVRHASDIHESSFAILTEDILVTNGDFSNPDLVHTSVSDHHFTWSTSNNSDPHGTINLLHTVPINEEVDQALKKVKNGDHVIITGYDIYQIQGYDSTGKYIGFWQDSGCNTTLVTEVQIINN
jgi:hypothetical protein